MKAAELASALLQVDPQAEVVDTSFQVDFLGAAPTLDKKFVVLHRLSVDRTIDHPIVVQAPCRPRVSPRGYVLIGAEPKVDYITVELAEKWYSLFIVRLGSRVEELGFWDLCQIDANQGRTCFVDHVPNPAAVEAYAGARLLEIDPIALELITGRWAIEGTP